MSQQALARRWRPRTFAELVGQDHVVKALTHALTTGRLHHAYLFTGTRGVGKTTISRIFAKALNCASGPTAEPCGQCDACRAIDADRFPDYLELDAASNRGVEDIAALLEQATYAPVAGRYKVYMIDEVHMLTGHAFNAMLKTLEEPPEHVKFVLATTDPQKIPVTVLSRCLQFHLRSLPPRVIAQRCAEVLTAEGVPFDASALTFIGQAAGGSMRDALSLLEQAIAYGGGAVRENDVAAMLGLASEARLWALLAAVAAADAEKALQEAAAIGESGVAFDAVLATLAQLLHRVALAQFVPSAAATSEACTQLAAQWDPEFVQLAYEIVLQGRRDLSLAPDEATGFTMTLLRLLAFAPQTTPQPAPLPQGPQVAPMRQGSAGRHEETKKAARADGSQESEMRSDAGRAPEASASGASVSSDAYAASEARKASAYTTNDSLPALADRWHALVQRLDLTGPARELVLHSLPLAWQDGEVELVAAPRVKALPQMHPQVVSKAQEAIARVLSEPARVRWVESDDADALPWQETPAARQAQAQRAAREAWQQRVEAQPAVRFLTQRLGLRLDAASVRLRRGDDAAA